MRIVSLIASATEIVCALGCEQHLVGRSHECDYPEAIQRLPVCTEPKFPVDGTSYDIDQRVKAIVQEGLSVYRVHGEVLKQLQPNVIVTQDHCEVCAVALSDVAVAAKQWCENDPILVSLSPQNLDDVWLSILQVADALEIGERGRFVVEHLRSRVDRLQQFAKQKQHRPTVACIEWIDPLMAAGNWVPELVELAGGSNLFGEAGKHAPWMTWESVVAKNPEVIVVLPCGFDIARSRVEMTHLTSLPGWQHVRAVQNDRVYLVDGNQYFNRPGPRLVESLEILIEIFHPDQSLRQHEGTGWVRWASN